MKEEIIEKKKKQLGILSIKSHKLFGRTNKTHMLIKAKRIAQIMNNSYDIAIDETEKNKSFRNNNELNLSINSRLFIDNRDRSSSQPNNHLEIYKRRVMRRNISSKSLLNKESTKLDVSRPNLNRYSHVILIKTGTFK